LAEEQSLTFSIKVVDKTLLSAAQFVKRILLRTYSSTHRRRKRGHVPPA